VSVRWAWLFLLCGGALVAGCEDEVMQSTAVPAPPASAKAGPADGGAKPTRLDEFSENDFAESDRNRDPFRSFAAIFVEQKKGPVKSQLATLLGQYSLEELKLMAIVQSGDYPRAMLKDPTGRGWVVKRGDYIGKAEVVHSGGPNGSDYMLNWRVDRIRDGDIVLVREDPGQPNVAPATRVVPLRSEAEKERERLEN
jgi:type IV pilus assembly protein PilP